MAKDSVGIVTDSIGCIPRDMVDEYGIEIVSPNIYFNGSVFRDWIDITPSQAYQLLEKDPDRFTTSAPPPEAFVEAYRKVSQRAASILCITLSSRVSTVHSAAVAAKEQLKDELADTNIVVLDSRTCTGAEGFVVLAGARALSRGCDMVGAVKAAEGVSEKVDLIFVLETIRHAYRTGRIPKIASQIGAWLSVKPVITWRDGIAHFRCMTRSKERGVELLVDAMRKGVGDKPVHVAVHHADAVDEGQRLTERVQREFNCAEVWLTEFSPIMGYSTGRGTLGLAYYTDD
ncbi:MAG: DegV family protein [Chloroflexi bacterium]|nr:DegV family protein [Chloroflexota bacterium]